MTSTNKIALGLVSLGLMATVSSTVSAQKCVTDVQLRASSSANPPAGPAGYAQIGYWDVDAGGSRGTNGSTGHYMMALYTKTASSPLVTDIQLRASSSAKPPTGPAGYAQVGYWDVDAGGSRGTNGSTGHYMMALYASKAKKAGKCVTDVQLRASNSAKPPAGPAGYAQIGYWDVDAGGSKGTNNSTGHYMMALYAKKSAVVPGGGGHKVTVKPGQSVGNINFGNTRIIDPKRGEIWGFKWNDLNGNGVREKNEPGLRGVTIYLDLNKNGRLDKNEPRQVTNKQGKYKFQNVVPGTYVVREVVPKGYRQTFPK